MNNDLKNIIRVLTGRLWLMILGVVLAAAIAYLTSRLTPPIYESSTTLLVNQAPSSVSSDYASILIKNEQLARTYADMMTQRPVLAEAIQQLQLPLSESELAKIVRVELVRDTQLLKLRVEHEDPQLAAAIANAVPQAFAQQNAAMQAQRYAESKTNLLKDLEGLSGQIEERQEQLATLNKAGTTAQPDVAHLQLELTQLQQSYSSLRQSYADIGLAEAQSTSNIVITEPAIAPEKPVRPRTLQNVVLGAVVGLMLALGVIFLWEYLDDRVRWPAQINTVLHLPLAAVIAHIPQKGKRTFNGGQRTWGSATLIALNEPRSPIAEAFRSLRTSIQFAGVDQPLQIVVVTSSGPGEGKSTVAANLAVVLAQTGRQTVLLDGDLRQPTAHTLLDVGQEPGLTNFMLQKKKEEDLGYECLRPTKVPSLWIVGSGPLPPNPSELLGSQRMKHFLQWLRERDYMVVIDTPPVLAVTDALILAAEADGVVLVTEAGSTRLESANAARHELEKVGAHLVGVVLNKATVKNGHYSYQYYYSKSDMADGVWRKTAPNETGTK